MSQRGRAAPDRVFARVEFRCRSTVRAKKSLKYLLGSPWRRRPTFLAPSEVDTAAAAFRCQENKTRTSSTAQRREEVSSPVATRASCRNPAVSATRVGLSNYFPHRACLRKPKIYVVQSLRFLARALIRVLSKLVLATLRCKKFGIYQSQSFICSNTQEQGLAYHHTITLASTATRRRNARIDTSSIFRSCFASLFVIEEFSWEASSWAKLKVSYLLIAVNLKLSTNEHVGHKYVLCGIVFRLAVCKWYMHVENQFFTTRVVIRRSCIYYNATYKEIQYDKECNIWLWNFCIGYTVAY